MYIENILKLSQVKRGEYIYTTDDFMELIRDFLDMEFGEFLYITEFNVVVDYKRRKGTEHIYITKFFNEYIEVSLPISVKFGQISVLNQDFNMDNDFNFVYDFLKVINNFMIQEEEHLEVKDLSNYLPFTKYRLFNNDKVDIEIYDKVVANIEDMTYEYDINLGIFDMSKLLFHELLNKYTPVEAMNLLSTLNPSEIKNILDNSLYKGYLDVIEHDYMDLFSMSHYSNDHEYQAIPYLIKDISDDRYSVYLNYIYDISEDTLQLSYRNIAILIDDKITHSSFEIKLDSKDFDTFSKVIHDLFIQFDEHKDLDVFLQSLKLSTANILDSIIDIYNNYDMKDICNSMTNVLSKENIYNKNYTITYGNYTTYVYLKDRLLFTVSNLGTAKVVGKDIFIKLPLHMTLAGNVDNFILYQMYNDLKNIKIFIDSFKKDYLIYGNTFDIGLDKHFQSIGKFYINDRLYLHKLLDNHYILNLLNSKGRVIGSNTFNMNEILGNEEEVNKIINLIRDSKNYIAEEGDIKW